MTGGWRLDRGASASLDELTLTRAAKKLLALDQNASAGEHHVGHAGHLDAFEHGVVHAHVMGLGADGVLALGIEDDQVGITAHRDRAFTGIEAEEFGRSGGDQFDEAIYAEASLRHSARVHQAHAMLDARAAVGNLGEVADSHLLLFLETKRTMIS